MFDRSIPNNEPNLTGIITPYYDAPPAEQSAQISTAASTLAKANSGSKKSVSPACHDGTVGTRRRAGSD